ncbi:MAG: molybdopterin molybdotransferase MoeA [Opitutales bacterium]
MHSVGDDRFVQRFRQTEAVVLTGRGYPVNLTLMALLSVAEASDAVMHDLPPLPVEPVPFDEAAGRILRQPITADRPLPPFDRATMDGIAVSTYAYASGLHRFRVIGAQPAGVPRMTLRAAEDCVEIMTGAVLPANADAVVRVEDIKRVDGWAAIREGTPVEPFLNVHRAGSDFRKGSELVPAGTRLSARSLAVAASCGNGRLAVTRQPRLAIVSTGDELVPVEATPEPYQIRRSNGHALAAAFRQRWGTDADAEHLPDDRDAVLTGLERLLTAGGDALVLSGGVSKGKKDYIPDVLSELGVVRVFQGVAQRPGKPFWFGRTPDGRPVFGLPGNPLSTLVGWTRYVAPALERMTVATPAPVLKFPLQTAFTFDKPLTLFLPVRLEPGPDGTPVATPVPAANSGDYARVVPTDGFLELPADQDHFPAGWCGAFFPWP